MENGFEQLEGKVKKAADLVKRLRQQNQDLEQELSRVRPRLDDAEKSLASLQRDKGASAEQAKKLDALSKQVDLLQGEREEIKKRISRLVDVLDGLE
jgi:predicted RNase H-like nuclease (RuvC/YqgF family)